MRFPFVSRERYDTDVARADIREQRLQDSLDAAHEKLLEMIDSIVELKMVLVSPEAHADSEISHSFELPLEVSEAIRLRAPRGSQLEGQLRALAERRLANGESETKDVVSEILSGSKVFDDGGW